MDEEDVAKVKAMTEGEVGQVGSGSGMSSISVVVGVVRVVRGRNDVVRCREQQLAVGGICGGGRE